MLVLADLDLAEIRAAVVACSGAGHDFPTPGDLRAFAVERAAPGEPTPLDAWGGVLEAIRRGTPITDPLAARAVQGLGGRRYVGMADESELSTIRAHFLKSYDVLQRREREDRAVSPQVRALLDGATVKKLMPGGGK
jgi:hypothetical protein